MLVITGQVSDVTLPLKVSSSKSKVSSPTGVTSLPGLALTSLPSMDAKKTNTFRLSLNNQRYMDLLSTVSSILDKNKHSNIKKNC